MKTLDLRRILIPVLMLMLSLIIPYEFYSQDGLFSINSLLISISYNPFNPYSSYWSSLNLELLFPSLLIFAPSFVWFYMERDMSVPKLLASACIVTFVMTLTLLLFLPAWTVFPWYPGGFLAYVPEFIELVPFSGLLFAIMILLPLIWRGLIDLKSEDWSRRNKVSAVVLSVAIILLPMSIDVFSWQGTDINRNFFEGFSLNSVTWSLSNELSGNRWGEGTWIYFSTYSIFAILSLMIQILPGIIFAWFVCRGSTNKKSMVQMFVAGLTQLVVVSLSCIWLNYTESHAGVWISAPVPALFVVGLTIFVINYFLQKSQSKHSPVSIGVDKREDLSQVIV
ncbi:MAG: hypothetical protein ACFFF9_15290 [Candidatus Thorarchaeota archaeon]